MFEILQTGWAARLAADRAGRLRRKQRARGKMFGGQFWNFASWLGCKAGSRQAASESNISKFVELPNISKFKIRKHQHFKNSKCVNINISNFQICQAEILDFQNSKNRTGNVEQVNKSKNGQLNFEIKSNNSKFENFKMIQCT